MKTTIILALMSILACGFVNAENKKSNGNEANCVENGLMLQYPNMINEVNAANTNQYNTTSQDYTQDKRWKAGRTLRTAGIAITAAGVVAVPIIAIARSHSIKVDGSNKALNDVAQGWLNMGGAAEGAVIGTGIAAVGAVIWVIGNSQMKKIRLQYTGNGLAYNF